jgi:hypothetical protein
MQVTLGDDGSPSAPRPRDDDDANIGDVAGGARRDRRRLLLRSRRASPGAGGRCGFSARPGLAAGGFMPSVEL